MQRVSPDALERYVTDILGGLDVPSETASTVARVLVDADLRGHRSHGVLRVPIYARMIEDGAIDPVATPVVERTSDTTVAVDGQSAFGQVIGEEAVETAVSMVDRHGCIVVGIRNSTHLGRIGEWAERTTDEGYLFAGFVNHQGGGRTVAPTGSAQRRLGTNPIAFGIPTYGALPFPIVYDAATSQVAHGKIREREKAGELLPEAWTTRADGDPVTDPAAFENGAGALLPLGGRTAGYKGFGLSVVAELFAGVIGDAPVAGQQHPEWTSNAAAFFVVDPTRFTAPDEIRERITAFADHLRSTEYHSSVPIGTGASRDETLLPGESEHRTAADRRERGIPLSEEVHEELRQLADSADVDSTLSDASCGSE